MFAVYFLLFSDCRQVHDFIHFDKILIISSKFFKLGRGQRHSKHGKLLDEILLCQLQLMVFTITCLILFIVIGHILPSFPCSTAVYSLLRNTRDFSRGIRAQKKENRFIAGIIR